MQVEEKLVCLKARSKVVVFEIWHVYDSKCHSYHYIYFKRLGDGNYIILLLYVGEIVVTGSNMQEINVLKRKFVN